MPKTYLRDNLLARRRHLSADSCLLWSYQIQQRVIASDAFRQARTLALYSPINNEVFTEDIFAQARRTGKQAAYPRVRETMLDFVLVEDRRQLVRGHFGVLEPCGSEQVAVSRLDLMVLPGVAFDHGGHRLGYGKGFYDRALHQAAANCLLLGLCFEFQRVESLPFEDHDVPVHAVVTEAGFYLTDHQSRHLPG